VPETVHIEICGGGGTGRPACRQAGAYASALTMYYVYSLKSNKKKYIYVGLTNNHLRRIQQHQDGREKTTNPYRPFSTILVEKYDTRQEARNREKYLKSGVGKEFLKKIIK